MAKPTPIWCIVHGEENGKPFSVRVGTDDTIDELKDLIKAKKPNYFRDIDANHIDLRRWNQPGNASMVKNVNLNSREVLNPMDRVWVIFDNLYDFPEDPCINVIVSIHESAW